MTEFSYFAQGVATAIAVDAPRAGDWLVAVSFIALFAQAWYFRKCDE